MTEFAKVLILALIQGVTELLPVSSSGHLVLAKHFLGLNSPGVTLEVALHAGTLLAVLVYYARRIAILAADLVKWREESRRYVLALVIGSLPAAVVGLVFKDWFEHLGDSPRLVAAFIMATGVVLLSLLLARRHDRQPGLLDSLLIGIAQAVAIAPGISRSGATIVMARHLGIEPSKAAEFSFLLMIPAVAGASVLELLHHDAWKTIPVSHGALAAGIVVSAVAGYVSMVLLVRMLSSGKFWVFGLYCVLAGGVGFMLLG